MTNFVEKFLTKSQSRRKLILHYGYKDNFKKFWT